MGYHQIVGWDWFRWSLGGSFVCRHNFSLRPPVARHREASSPRSAGIPVWCGYGRPHR
ncbi:hypothetical protein HMPREF9597_01163 [Cutibacterium acnes HL005PA4]|nr:hypothetical protein HMPREF9597_01163 [Cutibacterium acnes HL005PA4]